MSPDNLIQSLTVWVVPVLFAITLHEVAHGWVARALGDPTAASQGRLSLNPLRHIDPFGTVILPLLMLVLGGFMFGRAKPVPVDARNFRHPRQDMALVALAGPASNFAMAVLWALLYRFTAGATDPVAPAYFASLVGKAGIGVNVSFMVLNLLPLPPLDGGRVVAGLLPPVLAIPYSRLEPFGFIILLLLIASGMIGHLLAVPYSLSLHAVLNLAGLH